ncbi:protein of unknown function [Paraburkholderia dioscoreae]|uniref:Uncharacterized protein n=1 Tax=Paraburkholderia dioscoreae TaxID=2604047 RepID=A0A5Q4ZAI1_9BURK|nr:protein of unknown function [Paraburkholderia dioscoreae]
MAARNYRLLSREGNSYKKTDLDRARFLLKCAVTLRRTWSRACRAAGRGQRAVRWFAPQATMLDHDPCARQERVQKGVRLCAHYSSHANHQTTAFIQFSVW